jgi:hypothetical protein
MPQGRDALMPVKILGGMPGSLQKIGVLMFYRECCFHEEYFSVRSLKDIRLIFPES